MRCATHTSVEPVPAGIRFLYSFDARMKFSMVRYSHFPWAPIPLQGCCLVVRLSPPSPRVAFQALVPTGALQKRYLPSSLIVTRSVIRRESGIILVVGMGCRKCSCQYGSVYHHASPPPQLGPAILRLDCKAESGLFGFLIGRQLAPDPEATYQ